MLTVEVTVLELPEPSLTAKLTVLALVEGLSELLAYCTARSAACHWARVAVPPAEGSVIAPPPRPRGRGPRPPRGGELHPPLRRVVAARDVAHRRLPLGKGRRTARRGE